MHAKIHHHDAHTSVCVKYELRDKGNECMGDERGVGGYIGGGAGACVVQTTQALNEL